MPTDSERRDAIASNATLTKNGSAKLTLDLYLNNEGSTFIRSPGCEPALVCSNDIVVMAELSHLLQKVRRKAGLTKLG